MDQYQQKVNNYIKQCIVEIYNHGTEYHNNEEEATEEIKITAVKKTYINNIESSLKKLLNNSESILSHLKFELINNSSVSGKKNTFNENGILDMINCMESDYESNDGDEEDTDTLLNVSEDEDDSNETNGFNGTDSVKVNRYIDGTGEDEEEGNIIYDNSSNNSDIGGVEGCLVRQKRKEKKIADDDTPGDYFQDSDGYIYGQHCGRDIFKENICEAHFLKKEEKGNIELVTDYPLKYEKTIGKNEAFYSDSEKSLTRSKALELKPVTVKRKKYLIDVSNGHIFDARTHKFLGKREKHGKKYEYIFNS